MRYRSDIDGLRAIAVMSVVLFHAKFPVIHGGFIGVDIFFVISGYLITKIIHNELNADKFSIARFYERRIRRILPALFFMFTITTVIASVLFFPDDLVSFGKSMIASTLFTSNIFFWQNSNYFSNLSETQPLLHTWSLAVEEQFYIFFPLVLAFVHKNLRDKYLATTVVLAVSSFVFSVWLVSESATSAFYLASSRAWELLIGSLVAIGAFPIIKSQKIRECIAASGLGMLVFGIFTFSKSTLFPGASALIPCLGAACIIYAGEQSDTYTGRFLSLRPFVFIGLISYSLYLWHWPIIVFYSYVFYPTVYMKIGLVAASIGAGILSWHFVEKPWRKQLGQTKYSHLFGVTTSLMAFFVVVGVAVYMNDGFPSRYSKESVHLASYAKYEPAESFREGVCFLSSNYNDISLFNKKECLTLASNKKNYLLLGDSYAAHLWSGLAYALKDVNVMQATASGCKPLVNGKGVKRCRDLMTYIFNDYLPNTKIDALLISGRWANKDLPLLLETLTYVGKYAPKIYVLGPTVEYQSNLPRLLAISNYYNMPSLVTNSIIPNQVVTDEKIKQALADKGINYISTYHTLCSDAPNKQCKVVTESGVPFEFDYGHFTKEGSIAIATQWVRMGLIK